LVQMHQRGHPQKSVGLHGRPFNWPESLSLSAAIEQRSLSEPVPITKPIALGEAFRNMIDDWAEWLIGSRSD